MKLGIMQPYLFPYLGYFQLIHAVDKFVFYDDVNFIKNGWINRNRILLNGKPHYFTVPLLAASSFTPIKEIRFQSNSPHWKRKMLKTFALAYRDSPYFAEGMGLLEHILSIGTEFIGTVARESVQVVLRYLNVQRPTVPTSAVYSNVHLKGHNRVLDICRQEGADVYINAPGGRELHEEEDFRRAGVELRFLEGELPAYTQSSGSFVPGLSILDIIMRCSPHAIVEMLSRYRLALPSVAPRSIPFAISH